MHRLHMHKRILLVDVGFDVLVGWLPNKLQQDPPGRSTPACQYQTEWTESNGAP